MRLDLVRERLEPLVPALERVHRVDDDRVADAADLADGLADHVRGDRDENRVRTRKRRRRLGPSCVTEWPAFSQRLASPPPMFPLPIVGDVHRLLLSWVDSKSTSCDDLPVSVLRERNFRYLFAARTISFFGTNLAPIAVAFAVLGLGGSATQVGLAFAAWTLAQISTLLVGGVVADRLPRRLVMIGSDTASLCVRVTMGALLVSGHAQIWELIALQARRRRRGRVLLAGLDRARARDGSGAAAPAGEQLHVDRALRRLPARSGGRRHARGDRRLGLRAPARRRDLRE